jgi:RNA polymerase sigma-70 factor, ECF subfamily
MFPSDAIIRSSASTALGDSACGLPDLLPCIYDELRAIAARHLRAERRGHTLQTTAVLNEAYLRLAERDDQRWADRAAFCAAATQAVRRVLIDHARSRRAATRGGRAQRVALDAATLMAEPAGVDVLALDEALIALAALAPRQARIVELRHFGGLSEDETAQVLAVSRRTVQKDWRLARAWLLRRLSATATAAGGP